MADFTPSVNAAAQSKAALGQIGAETLNVLLIDPKMGYVGLGVSLAIWGGAFIYVKQLVSAMWKGSNDSIAVCGLKLPLLTEPKVLTRTVYDPNSNQFDDVENIQFTQSELESENDAEFYSQGELSISGEKDTNDLLVKFDGDFCKKVGHLALKINDSSDNDNVESSTGTSSVLSHLFKQKHLLDIGSGEEIMPNASPHLLRSLVIRDHHLMTGGKKAHNNGDRKESWKHSIKPDEGDEDNSANSINVGRSIKKKGGFRSTRRKR